MATSATRAEMRRRDELAKAQRKKERLGADYVPPKKHKAKSKRNK